MFFLAKLQGELKTMVWNKRHCHKLKWIVRSKRGQLLEAKARSKRRSIHAPNPTDELSTAEERRLNQFGSAHEWSGVWTGPKCTEENTF